MIYNYFEKDAFVNRLAMGLAKLRLPLGTEKEMQDAVEKYLKNENIPHTKEHIFDAKNIFDFFVAKDLKGNTINLVIETKLKQPKRKIYDQCERYCQLPEVQNLILLTNTSIGFPKQINTKNCYVVNIGKAWL